MSSAIDEAAAAERRPVLVDLALQGGGSHGAFTWGSSTACSKSHGSGSRRSPGHRPEP